MARIRLLGVFLMGMTVPCFAVASHEYLRPALRDADPQIRQDALEQLVALGSDGTEFVEDVLPSLTDTDPYTRYHAVNAVRSLLMCSDLVVDSVAERTADRSRDVRLVALQALAACGRYSHRALPKIEAALADRDAAVRQAAVTTMKALGPTTRSAIPAMLAFAAKEPARRADVAAALAATFAWPTETELTDEVRAATRDLGDDVAVVMRALLAWSADPDLDTRVAAVKALAQNSAMTWEAAEVVLKFAADPEEEVRRAAVPLYRELLQSGSPALAEAATERLVELTRDDVMLIRKEAADALQWSSSDDVALPALANALRDPSAAVREAALSSMKSFRAAPGYVQGVIALANDPSAEVRAKVPYALEQVAADDPDTALPVIVKLTADPSVEVRMAGAETLGTMVSIAAKTNYIFGLQADRWLSENATAAVARLNGLLADRSHEVRKQAIAALELIAPLAPPDFDALRRALRDDRAAVRAGAVRILQSHGPAAAPAAADIAALTEDSSSEVAAAALSTIRYLGPSGSTAIPALRRMLNDEDDDNDVAAMQALAGLGASSAVALPELLTVARRDYLTEDTRNVLTAAFVRIGPAAVKALEADAATAPEEPPPAHPLFAKIHTTTKDHLTSLLNDVRKRAAGTTYTVRKADGSTETLTVNDDTAVVAVATWCNFSKAWRHLIASPLLSAYVRDHVRLLVDDEWPTIEKKLDRQVETKKMTAEEKMQLLSELKDRSGTPLYDPTFLDGWKEQTVWHAPGAATADGVPSMLNPATGQFDGDEMAWLRSRDVPPKVIALAEEAARKHSEE